jgi:hypothetical protein
MGGASGKFMRAALAVLTLLVLTATLLAALSGTVLLLLLAWLLTAALLPRIALLLLARFLIRILVLTHSAFLQSFWLLTRRQPSNSPANKITPREFFRSVCNGLRVPSSAR